MRNRFLPVIFATKISGLPYYKHIFIPLTKNYSLAVLPVIKMLKTGALQLPVMTKNGNNSKPKPTLFDKKK